MSCMFWEVGNRQSTRRVTRGNPSAFARSIFLVQCEFTNLYLEQISYAVSQRITQVRLAIVARANGGLQKFEPRSKDLYSFACC